MSELAPGITRIPARSEEICDGVVHAIGVLFALVVSPLLLWHVSGLAARISLTVYCCGLMAMLGFSAAYNMTRRDHPLKKILRRIDHAAIFIMIAATYTPLAVNLLAPPWGAVILIAIWSSAILGMTIKLAFPHRYEKTGIALYLLMGWMVVAVIVPLYHAMVPVNFWLLMAGSAVYSLGVLFFVFYRLPFNRAIWHGLVLLAAVLQFSSLWGEFAR